MANFNPEKAIEALKQNLINKECINYNLHASKYISRIIELCKRGLYNKIKTYTKEEFKDLYHDEIVRNRRSEPWKERQELSQDIANLLKHVETNLKPRHLKYWRKQSWKNQEYTYKLGIIPTGEILYDRYNCSLEKTMETFNLNYNGEKR